tara:strand:+ start:1038 stop:1610 length:573 start_codon:yes stop_codon:yes gene_type:complete
MYEIDHNIHARMYATRMHEGQFRKYSNLPYITHPIAVANIVRINIPNFDYNMIAAAYLHDVVEDTSSSIDDIMCTFGDDIAMLVACLTKVSKKSDGNRPARVSIDQQHLANAPTRAQLIKLADIDHNVNLELIDNDLDFARPYILEKIDFLHAMNDEVMATDFYKSVFEKLTELELVTIAKIRERRRKND